MLSALRVSAGTPSVTFLEKLRHHTKVPASFLGIRLFGRNKRLCFVEHPVRLLYVFASDVLKAVPNDRSFACR